MRTYNAHEVKWHEECFHWGHKSNGCENHNNPHPHSPANSVIEDWGPKIQFLLMKGVRASTFTASLFQQISFHLTLLIQTILTFYIAVMQTFCWFLISGLQRGWASAVVLRKNHINLYFPISSFSGISSVQHSSFCSSCIALKWF